MKIVFATLLALGAVIVGAQDVKTTAETLQDIYYACAESSSPLSCAKPKFLSYLSDAVKREKVPITEDLTIVRSFKTADDGDDFYSFQGTPESSRVHLLRSMMLEKLDDYLSSHYVEARLPETIIGSDIVPRSLIDNVPRSVSVPLTDSPNGQGRGFVKKVVIPFLLGLKFKATAIVPLALALIALKTWKALTLGLLSIVLSGALLIFKLTKPKVAYEVVHYGHPPVETPAHWETSANGPYRGYRK